MRRPPSADPAAGALTPELELTLRLAGVRERREAARERILELVDRIDIPTLTARLEAQKLVPLIGLRLVETARERLPVGYHDGVYKTIDQLRVRAALIEGVSSQLSGALERAGVAVVVLKGPMLARRLYGDPGMRVSLDLDFVVSPESFHDAVDVLAEQGYERPADPAWRDGLPLFEASLIPVKPWLPPIDLHWRLGWHDAGFSERVIERSVATGEGMRIPAAEDELAMLLLMYARDGFYGLRAAADLAAWWDELGATAGERPLDRIASAHAPLATPLRASATVVERLVGVPASKLIADGSPLPPAARLALRLGNWSMSGPEMDQLAGIVLVDGLLTPRGGRLDFVRRHFAPPAEVVADAYGLEGAGPVLRRAKRLRYAAVMSARLAPGLAKDLWRVRRGEPLAPAPPRP